MKSAMGAVVALALGIGLAATAGATGTNQQSTMPSQNIQSGSTQQMQQKQIRPQRHAVRNTTQHRKLALVRGQRVKGKMTLAQKHRISKTRLATLHRRNQNQNQNPAVGVGSSMPNTGSTTITPPTTNNAGGNQNLNITQPKNQ